MILLPAIDLIAGQCVRLYQGDYSQVTTYSADPVEVAQRWQNAGASWLHIVDLDGARAGHPVNTDSIARIRAATTLKIEVGGGLRTVEHLASVLDLGVERAILGTAAITGRELLAHALQRWGARIVVGLDARDSLVAISGWRDNSGVKATELAQELSASGVQRFIYTDIARDGAMQGPNTRALAEMQRSLSGSNAQLIASGGVSSLADLQALATLNVEGAIIGKALYTDSLNLEQALRIIEQGQQGAMTRESTC